MAPELSPYYYVVPPAEGIYDYNFFAKRPAGPSAQVLTVITAEVTRESIPKGMRGVPIHSATNTKVGLIHTGPRSFGIRA